MSRRTLLRHRDRKVASFTAADERALLDYASRDAARRYTRGSIAIQNGHFSTREDIEKNIATLRALLEQAKKRQAEPCR